MQRNPRLLDRSRSLVWVVDLQERLLPSIAGHAEVTRAVIKLLEVTRRLGVPAIFTEQYPRGLGHTVAEVSEYGEGPAIEKTAFSAFAEEALPAAVAASGRDQLIVCGIETHICVFEGALDALASGLQVVVAADATSSGSEGDRRLGLEQLARAGVDILPSESIIYQLIGRAGTDEFRGLIDLLRRDPVAT